MKRPPAKVSKPASCPGCGTCQALPVEGDAVKHEGRGKPVEEHDEGFDPQPVEIIRNLPGRGKTIVIRWESHDVHQSSFLPTSTTWLLQGDFFFWNFSSISFSSSG